MGIKRVLLGLFVLGGIALFGYSGYSMIGVSVATHRDMSLSYSEKYEFDSVKVLQDAGAQIVRVYIPYVRVGGVLSPNYPKPWGLDRFNTIVYGENLIDRLYKQKIPVLFCIDLYPLSINLDATPGELDNWLAYIKKYATKYANKVKYWQVTCEVDQFEYYNQDFERYIKHLKAARDVIKAIIPDAIIVSGAYSRVQDQVKLRNFVTTVYPHVDILALAIYPLYLAVFPPEQFVDLALTAVKEVASSLKLKEKPIWITECGHRARPVLSDLNLQILKKGVKLLDFNPDKNPVYCLTTAVLDTTDIAKQVFPKVEAPQFHKIQYSEISTLPNDALLVLPKGGLFPSKYTQDLVRFVNNGGILLHPGGYQAPFSIDMPSLEGRGRQIFTRLNVYANERPARVDASYAFWADTNDGLPLYIQENITFPHNMCNLMDYNAGYGGTVYPILLYKQSRANKTNTVAAAIKFASGGGFIGSGIYETQDWASADLTPMGNTIVNTREMLYCITESRVKTVLFEGLPGDVRRVVPLFGYQYLMDRVGKWRPYYGLDFHSQPMFLAFKNLTTLIEEDTKIDYSKSDGLCKYSWTAPSGDAVSTFYYFELFEPKEVVLKLKLEPKPYKVVDITGKVLESGNGGDQDEITFNPEVAPKYIVGAKVLDVEVAPSTPSVSKP